MGLPENSKLHMCILRPLNAVEENFQTKTRHVFLLYERFPNMWFFQFVFHIVRFKTRFLEDV